MLISKWLYFDVFSQFSFFSFLSSHHRRGWVLFTFLFVGGYVLKSKRLYFDVYIYNLFIIQQSQSKPPF